MQTIHDEAALSRANLDTSGHFDHCGVKVGEVLAILDCEMRQKLPVDDHQGWDYLSAAAKQRYAHCREKTVAELIQVVV